MFLLKVCFFLVTATNSIKILVAGDQNTDFYEKLASSIAGQHTVVKFSRLLNPILKHKKEDGVTLYGIGNHSDKFKPVDGESYYDQMRRFDLELARVYFG